MTSAPTDTTVEQLVARALDRLPDWILGAIADVAILVLDGGPQAHAYGLAAEPFSRRERRPR